MDPFEVMAVASGRGLNVAERAGLEVAMLEVKLAEKLASDLCFWGRITGDTADYLIVSTDGLTKKFYYTTTMKPEKLSQMPELQDAFTTHAATLKTQPFSGDPSTPYEMAGEEEPKMDENGDPIQPEIFREEHRLAFHVKIITNDACVVPRGAYLVDAQRQVVPNKTYDGLTFEAAGYLTSYFHLRPPTSPHAQKALEKPGLVRAADFLDPVHTDAPSGTWALNFDASKRIAFLRSLYYPGALFFHVVNTSTFGNVYFGDGLPNDDLPFML